MTTLGRHLIIEVYEADKSTINNPAELEKIFLEAARLANATVLSSHFHTYHPQGVSGVIIISESHFTVHTWPEYGYAAIDIFYCDDKVSVENAVQHLAAELGTEKIFITADLKRGILAV
jgi:S-adenosylmethionine decarboxylase